MATILIVEDHAMSRQVLTTLLGYMGHCVLEADDGIAALALARSEHPDLIISDIFLPKMDGLEFIRQLRSETALKEKPVVFYTATCRLPEDLRLDETYRTCRVIPKPSEPHFIIQTVNEVLGISSTGFAPQPEIDFPRPALAQPAFSQSTDLQLAVLMDLSYSMVAQRNPKLLLNTVSQTVREILNCRYSLLAIQEDDGKPLYFSGRTENESCPDYLLPPPEILERVVTGREAVRWQKRHYASPAGAYHYLPRVESLLAVPFASPSRVYGWICHLDKLNTGQFSNTDEEMAMALSTQAALAYENILLVEKQRKNETHLEGLVAARTAELERANAELLKSQKLESIGVLAGGIAHDFNNALTAITNHIQIVKMKTNPEDHIYRNLHLAEKACYNAQSLTRQLLTFAKGGSPVKKVVALPDLLRDTAKFAIQGSNVKCEFSIAPDIYVVEIDQGLISQVITNLIINAKQAMPEGGIVRVSAENIVIQASDSLPIKEGPYVRLSVIDHGVGIPHEYLHRIFDPYFTTKKIGSGLGLASAYSIIKNHDGHIAVESEKCTGTAFHIYLSASDKKLDQEIENPDIRSDSGRLLIIEDHELIAESLVELLRINGYAADAIRDGADGLKLYEKNMKTGFAYDAVIMDLTIPGGMGGKETIKRLREMDPGVMAIVASGYSNDPVMANYREYGFYGAISKPYFIEDMITELRRIKSLRPGWEDSREAKSLDDDEAIIAFKDLHTFDTSRNTASSQVNSA